MKHTYKRYLLITAFIAVGTTCSSAEDEASANNTEAAPVFVLPPAEEGESEVSEASDEAVVALPGNEAEAAAGSEMDDEVFQVLPDFVVSADRDQGYYSANSLAGTRTNQLIKNTPMTISVVNQDLINDLNLFGVEGLGDVVPSIEAEAESFSNRLLRFRGLLTRFQLFEFMPRQLSQNSYNVDRIDIVRGANSLIYGQAAPGGKANYLTKRANFGGNETTLDFLIGENDLVRGSFDTNYTINDKVAVRIMGTHQEQGFDQDYKEQEFDGATFAVTYRPTNKTQFQFHLEGVQEYRNSPPSIYSDLTGQYGYTGMLRGMPATADVVDRLDRRTLNYLINYNDGFGLAPLSNNNGSNNNRVPDFFTSKQDIKDFYTKQILIPNPEDVADLDPYLVSYGAPSHNGTSPSKGGTLSLNERDVDGFFALADVTHSFTDELQGKIAISREEQNTSLINRGDPRNIYLTQRANNGRAVQLDNGTGARAYADGFFVSPFWQRGENSDDTTAFRGTLSWTKEIWGTEQQFLLGVDLDRRESEESQERYLAVAANPDGTFAGSDQQEDFSQVNSGNDNGVNFNTTGDNNVTGNILTDTVFTSRAGRDGEGWYLAQEREARVDGKALWFALQGSYMNGRLNTLTGIRFDRINVQSEVSDIQAGILGNKIDEDFNHTSPSLGVLFWVTDSLGVFVNYAQSIESPNGWALDPNGNSVPAETGTGLEGGIKFDMLDGKLNGQLIFFHIEKENERKSDFSNAILEVLYPYSDNPLLYPDATGPGDTGSIDPLGRNVAGSTVISEGIELDLYYNPTPSLSLFLGYAYVDTYYKETAGGILDGQTLAGTAHHNANFTVRYTFKDGPFKGWYLGANEKYRSRGLYDTLYEDLDFDGQEDVLGLDNDMNGSFNDLGDTAPRTHEIWLDDNLETTVFVGWRGKFAQGKDAALWNFQFTVNNLFDSIDLISTGQALYTQGRTLNLKASVKF
ncbi:MAG: TonB-dependent receptor [Puniceicoccaceae bacterium]|nr:TonB-dependent receptor [Puniceicoccaceae bacterium]